MAVPLESRSSASRWPWPGDRLGLEREGPACTDSSHQALSRHRLRGGKRPKAAAQAKDAANIKRRAPRIGGRGPWRPTGEMVVLSFNASLASADKPAIVL